MRRSRPIAVADPITELFAYLSITDLEGGMDSMNDYLPFPKTPFRSNTSDIKGWRISPARTNFGIDTPRTVVFRTRDLFIGWRH